MILLYFVFASHVWFLSRSLGYPGSGAWLSRKYRVCTPSGGMRLKLNQTLSCHSQNFWATVSQHILHVGQIVGLEFCSWVREQVSLSEARRASFCTKEIRMSRWSRQPNDLCSTNFVDIVLGTRVPLSVFWELLSILMSIWVV